MLSGTVICADARSSVKAELWDYIALRVEALNWRRMAFDKEFQHHLHEIMVAASLQVRDEIQQHKRELIFKAQKTNNAAALPIAYSDSSIYAFKIRAQRVIDLYLQALEDFRILVDTDTEREMLQ